VAESKFPDWPSAGSIPNWPSHWCPFWSSRSDQQVPKLNQQEEWTGCPIWHGLAPK
ncbi:hypothetical protein OGATHE_001507, partial [Ogataea polymorpha]